LVFWCCEARLKRGRRRDLKKKRGRSRIRGCRFFQLNWEWLKIGKKKWIFRLGEEEEIKMKIKRRFGF